MFRGLLRVDSNSKFLIHRFGKIFKAVQRRTLTCNFNIVDLSPTTPHDICNFKLA